MFNPISDAAQAYIDEKFYTASGMVREIAGKSFDAGHAAALATVFAEPEPVTPRTITTAADLDALPDGQLLASQYGTVIFEKAAPDRFCRVSTSSLYPNELLLTGFAPLTLLVPATAAPEPVRLLDPDDPRIKPGAVLQWHNIDEPFTVGGGVTNANAIRSTLRKEKSHSGLYLIAEAPADPDEPILAALRVNGFVADQLAALRAAGYDVVKQAL